MVESGDPESPFLTPKMVLKHQVSVNNGPETPQNYSKPYINVFLLTIRTF